MARERKRRHELLVAEERRQARTLLAMGRFLNEFATCGIVIQAADVAGVSRRTVNGWRKTSPQFAALYDEALEDGVERMEQEARRRAVVGVLEPMVSAGCLVTHVRKYSDALLMMLLKAKKPDVYRERHEFTGKDGKDLFTAETIGRMPTEDLLREYEAELVKWKAVLLTQAAE